MPPPVTADWGQVKATAIATGSLIEAADHHGLKYEAVRQRASREQWPVGRRVIRQLEALKEQANAQVTRAGQMSVTPVVTSVTTTSEALQELLADDSRETRISLSRAARRMAKEAEGAPLDQAQNALQTAKLAALTHGWAEASDTRAVSIQVLTQISIEKQ